MATINPNNQRRVYGHRPMVDEHMLSRIRNHRKLMSRRARLDHGPNHRRNPPEHHRRMCHWFTMVTMVGSLDLQEAPEVRRDPPALIFH